MAPPIWFPPNSFLPFPQKKLSNVKMFSIKFVIKKCSISFWCKMALLLKKAHVNQKFYGPCGLTSDPHCISESVKWSKYKKFYTISPAYTVGQTLVHMDQKNFEFT